MPDLPVLHSLLEFSQIQVHRASLVAQLVKNLPAMWETWVRSPGGEDPLEKEMATHSSIVAWRIPGTGSLVGCHLWARNESDTTERLHFLSFFVSALGGHGEGDGTPLQHSCLENPMAGGAW